ncbi:MAG: precorrin-2 C(20)-methyltransferase [Butyrivibrio sp.]|nr:precorrin-2 C(20)-methyltransferase [Butyrivibrio sp.]
MIGTLYGVGTGPGDSELMTLKAVRIVRECDVIAIPVSNTDLSTEPELFENNSVDDNKKEILNSCVAYKITLPNVPEMEHKKIFTLPMPMCKDKAELKRIHETGAQAIANLLKEGKNVCFLTIGDPTVYSTYLYVHKRILKLGYPAEIINGIPSFCSVAAKLGIGLVENKNALHVIPSSYGVEEALKLSGTKVFMKAGKKMAKVKDDIKKTDEKFYMMENCGMSDEKIYTDINQVPDETSYFSLIILKEED